MTELKPCPHCGPGQSMCDAVESDIGHRWQVFCGRCGSSSGSTKTRAEAVALWNTRPAEVALILRMANISATIAWQAGVGGMETAGAIVSYLAANPDQIETVLFGEGVFATPVGIAEYPMYGCLTWHGQNGKIVDPETARHAQLIRKMARGESLSGRPS